MVYGICLRDHFHFVSNIDLEVIAVCLDVGQGDDMGEVKGKAIKTGAVKKTAPVLYLYPTLFTPLAYNFL
jgi:hypothetical protein